MSFLMKLQEEGRRAKSTLKKTNTVVTDTSGRKLDSETGSYEVVLGFVEDTCPDPGVYECANNVYIGSQDAALNWDGMEVPRKKSNVDKNYFPGMKEIGITHVLNLFSAERPFENQDVVYMNHTLMDIPEQKLLDTLDVPLQFIEKILAEDGKVLVHCNAGVSRSAAIIIAHLIKHQRMSYDSALERIRHHRPSAKPNAGFEQQLRQFETDILNP
ncbi:unnamed protein product [Cylindrotheca closterium]|uniref:Protein-tyrosine-phosphatase n=1 Tax=Cylindrotheca closterium TaxID=2856 RepID=A0AAD2G4S1_9STRA|nr:unnamed protein product [Cylindrotheca closterium]